MTFIDLFGDEKPIIGMVHLNSDENHPMLETAISEIELYLHYGIYPLIENYFGSAEDCETVLKWMHETHPDAIYGLNVLGDAKEAFRLAAKYGVRFVQIDSVCGHLTPEYDEKYAEALADLRKKADVMLIGGVRFKYKPVLSGRSLDEDLRLGRERCDAIACTGEGTGLATPMEKVGEFKKALGDFPVIVAAGVTLDTAAETARRSDGVIVGSWLKDNHRDYGYLKVQHVRQFVDAFRSI